jgi:hypothetical protein
MPFLPLQFHPRQKPPYSFYDFFNWNQKPLTRPLAFLTPAAVSRASFQRHLTMIRRVSSLL